MNVPPPPNPRALLEAANLRAKKAWGQNFLRDQNILALIAAETRASPGQPIVELGAGLGALTYHLALIGHPVLAIERDRDLAPILRDALNWAENLTVREADAAALDYSALAQELGQPPVVAGNLPYQLSSRILVSLADACVVEPAPVTSAVVMIQREVAERLTAPPGSRAYGLLTVLVGRTLTARLTHRVPPGAFHPPPKVESAVVRLDVRPGEDPLRSRDAAEDARLVATARAAFAQRRKTLRKALSSAFAQPGEAMAELLDGLGIDPRLRAEVLGLEDFRRIGRALGDAGWIRAKI